MSFLNWLSGAFASSALPSAPPDQQPVNPASGLPMVGSVDIAGNVYGTQAQDHAPSSATHDWHSSSPSHTPDTFGSSSSSWTPSQDFSRPPTGSSGDW